MRIHRRKNPQWEIVAQRGKGPLLWFDGRKFTNNDHNKRFTGTFAVVHRKATFLLRRFSMLSEKGYHVWVRKLSLSRRDNPESPGLDEAAKKLEDFTGHDASQVIETSIPAVKEGLVIGELDLIGYRVKREGIEGGRTVSYGHRFRKRSRPLLAVSKDGNQLLIVGGQYEFTEAGIEDR